jgi:hypothetical protein
MADQLPYVQGLIDASPEYDFAGQTYEIAGDFVLPDGAFPQNLNLIQIAPSSTRKSITKTGGWIKGFKNVTVDRGTDMASGALGTSSGIHLVDVRGVEVFDGIEVFGHGKGAGVYLQNIFRPRLGKISVHDLRYSEGSIPGTERLFGIWLNQCSHFELVEPDVQNIDALIGGVVKVVQTDGITISGCTDFSVIRPYVNGAAECIDLTGSVGNRNFEIIGGELHNGSSYGLKIANSGRQGNILFVKTYHCGRSGFAVSGPGQAGLPKIEQIQFSNCKAINTGSNGLYSNENVSGFSVQRGEHDITYPQAIHFYECLAEDNQTVKTMKYGFRNENNHTSNIIRNCTSVGHTVASALGTWG